MYPTLGGSAADAGSIPALCRICHRKPDALKIILNKNGRFRASLALPMSCSVSWRAAARPVDTGRRGGTPAIPVGQHRNLRVRPASSSRRPSRASHTERRHSRGRGWPALDNTGESEIKQITHAIRMAADNAETVLVRTPHGHYARASDEAYVVAREALTASGDIHPAAASSLSVSTRSARTPPHPGDRLCDLLNRAQAHGSAPLPSMQKRARRLPCA